MKLVIGVKRVKYLKGLDDSFYEGLSMVENLEGEKFVALYCKQEQAVTLRNTSGTHVLVYEIEGTTSADALEEVKGYLKSPK